MKPTIIGRFLIAATLLMSAGVAGAADKKAATAPTTDAGLAESVRHAIVMYPHYDIWDDLGFQVANGHVTLMGAVNQPYKKTDIERLVGSLPGVAQVEDDIRVLPLSPQDDRLRLIVARAIYGDPTLRRYAIEPMKPIHILVENGHVTLAGVVATEMDKNIAGMRAASAGLSFGSIVNNLQVEHPPARKS
jgi:hyperosmotically inducible protein